MSFPARHPFAALRADAALKTASAQPHRPVMLKAALNGLAVHKGGCYIDATYGRGGHSAAILDVLDGQGMLHALDQDPEAGTQALRSFGKRPDFRFHSTNFSRLWEVAAAENLAGRVDGILFDLGVSSPQLDEAGRGFSFLRDGPLDMRMNPREGVPAKAWLARAREEDIADVLWRLGEERQSRRIAHAIVEARRETPIETTVQLAAIIASAARGPRQKIHPATRSFQAIRLHVNRELEVLVEALRNTVDLLAPHGRLVVISFHSLEDRLVKRFIRGEEIQASEAGVRSSPRYHSRVRRSAREAELLEMLAEMEPPPVAIPPFRSIGRYFPDSAEIAANPRARSAVLRVAERRAEDAGDGA